MRYRLSEIEATGPRRFYALRIVRPALEFSLSISTSSSRASSTT